jgi:hypothetical protein
MEPAICEAAAGVVETVLKVFAELVNGPFVPQLSPVVPSALLL